ncbi:MAG: phytanoyl-CoA dioxygenase family protein [Chitinophagales bacterium]|nr:phytanoyl-CoA dioxygenase family protein [Chitinophagales bacterium]
MKATPIAENVIVKEKSHRHMLLNHGYFVADFADENTLQKIDAFYRLHHHFNANNGGSFWSIYSQNEQYKRETHQFLEEVLLTFKKNYLQQFRTLINAFVVKTSGKNSAFDLHQDTTAMDEERYSPLSIWIPLQDVNETNGCLHIVPYTHHYTSYYRAVSVPSKFSRVAHLASEYAVPIPVSRGQALFFDNRVLHLSPPFDNGLERVAVVCGVMPQIAAYINCFKNEAGDIEVYEQQDDFVLSNPYFLKNSEKRPTAGNMIKKAVLNEELILQNQWEEIIQQHQLVKSNFRNTSVFNSSPIQEPI